MRTAKAFTAVHAGIVIYVKMAGLCGEKRITRLMRKAQLRSVRGYQRPRYRVGMPSTTAPDRLQREFTVAQPDQV